MKNADKPVNPGISSIENGDGNLCAVFTENGNAGITKREYFAGLAMQGFINNTNSSVFIAEKAVKLADELLIQLEKK